MAHIEILAPVGSEEMLRAAVFSGADAVYLGFSGFNARTGAGNFDADSLRDAVSFCHARGVRVHVAMNTTVYDGELAQLAEAVRAVAASGADAVICQDLAVAELIAQIAPELPRHASTQMSAHTLEGALELKELGFKRVILARELSLKEIESITKNCGIETEVFVHGALCMSMSGQCYMSAFLGGRSGNRGSCAGPCRLPFDASAVPEGMAGRAHHLSLKDNSVLDRLAELEAMGVASAKIEGRLRTPEYVAAAVNAALAGREGKAYDRELLKNAFSRSGFTNYLDGKIDGQMFGTRSEADAALTRKTLPALRELYRRERSCVPVTMKLEIEEGGAKLTVTDDAGRKAFAYGADVPQPALNDPAESLRRSLAKTGGTPFAAAEIRVEMDGGPWYLPGSAVNELRRAALDALQQKRAAVQPWPTQPYAMPAQRRHESKPLGLRARFANWAQVPLPAEYPGALDGVEYLSLPIAEAEQVPAEWRAKTILELPRAMFGALEADTARRIEATRTQGFAGYEANNIAHLHMAKGLPLFGGIGLNLTNDLAAQFYAEQGLQSLLILPEVKDSDIATIAPLNPKTGRPVPTGALIYGFMPLMLTRACPLQNVRDCAHCNKRGELTDRKAKKFQVRCGLGVRTIYNPVPIYMGDKPNALVVDYGVAYFTLESAAEAAAMLDNIRRHKPLEGEFTRGLYFKGTC
jgi:putative protease